MLTLATAGGSQTVKASVLLPGPLAQWQSGRLLISRFRVRSPGGLLERRWRNGKRARLLSGRSGFDSSATRSRSVGVNGYLTRPSTWGLRVRTPHGARAAPSSMGSIRGLRPRERGSTPRGLPRSGVTGTCRPHKPGDEGSNPSCATSTRRLCVRSAWQFAHTTSRLAISAISRAKLTGLRVRVAMSRSLSSLR